MTDNGSDSVARAQAKKAALSLFVGLLLVFFKIRVSFLDLLYDPLGYGLILFGIVHARGFFRSSPPYRYLAGFTMGLGAYVLIFSVLGFNHYYDPLPFFMDPKVRQALAARPPIEIEFGIDLTVGERKSVLGMIEIVTVLPLRFLLALLVLGLGEAAASSYPRRITKAACFFYILGGFQHLFLYPFLRAIVEAGATGPESLALEVLPPSVKTYQAISQVTDVVFTFLSNGLLILALLFLLVDMMENRSGRVGTTI